MSVCLINKESMPRPKKSDTPVREKILSVANDLFYLQGYHQTGTNQLIREAGVSKASFYDNFPSKKDLAVAYVEESALRSIQYIRGELDKKTDPFERYMVFAQSIHSFLKETDFRGCNFSNIAREFPDVKAPVRQKVIEFEMKYHALLRETVEALFASDPKRYRKLPLDVDQMTDRYYLLLEGAINASANFHDDWPLIAAEPAIRDLVQG